jgi:uncharacterized OB-fold protein
MFCSECGQANADAARFCTGCGTALTQRVEQTEKTEVAVATQQTTETPHLYGVVQGAVSPFQVTPTEIPPYNSVPSAPLIDSPPFAPTSPAAPPTGYSAAPPIYGAMCRVCGTALVPNMAQCPRCSTPIGMIVNANDPTANSYVPVGIPVQNVPYGMGQPQITPNNSGQGGSAPADLPGGWNWGASFVTYFWAAAHRVWWYVALQTVLIVILLTLLIASTATSNTVIAALLGLAGILYAAIWSICRVSFGIHGNRIAWRKRHFDHIYQFVDVQEAWKPVGIVMALIAFMCLLAIGGVFLLGLIGMNMMKL